MLSNMVMEMAKKRAKRRAGAGRPPTPPLQRLTERQMLRLDPVILACVESHRRAMEQECGERCTFGDAARDMLRFASREKGYLPRDK